MKTKTFAIILILTSSIVNSVSAQMLMSGDLLFIKNEKIINTEFVYDSMGVGKFKTEAEYTLKKVIEHNDSRPGKGDQWLADWNDRKAIDYPNAFIASFNKKLKKSGLVAVRQQSSAKYTIVIRTLHFEAGFSGYMYVTELSNVELEILFYESNDRSHLVAKLYFGTVAGAGGVPASAYSVAGSITGKYLLKNVYQNKK